MSTTANPGPEGSAESNSDGTLSTKRVKELVASSGLPIAAASRVGN